MIRAVTALSTAFLLVGCQTVPSSSDTGSESKVRFSDASGGTLDIQRKHHLNVMPPSDLGGKRIFIEIKGSEKASQFLRGRLASQGFHVVNNPSDADAQFRLDGIALVGGIGRKDVKIGLGELLELSGSSMPGTLEYQHQSITLVQIAAASAYTGLLSPVDVIQWLGDKTGVSGKFNEMITGDPRGICIHKDCNLYNNWVVVSVRGNSGHWWIEESVKDERVVLDLLVADAIENVLKPIVDLRPEHSGAAE